MDDKEMIKEFDRFAKAIGGKVDKDKSSFANPMNSYVIQADKNNIELIWADRPFKGQGAHVTLETRFRYQINNADKTTLSVTPNDFFSKTLSVFKKAKQKTGVKELDNAYIFSSSSDGLVFALTDSFKDFYKNNHYKNFNIETEIITDTPTLTIFIPELITTEKKLKYYYDFGLKVAKTISADTST